MSRVTEVADAVVSGAPHAPEVLAAFLAASPPQSAVRSLLAIAVSVDAPAPVPEMLVARVSDPVRFALPCVGGRASVVVAIALGRDVDVALARTSPEMFPEAARAAGDRVFWPRVALLSASPGILRAAVLHGRAAGARELDKPEILSVLTGALFSDATMAWAEVVAELWFHGDLPAVRHAFRRSPDASAVLAHVAGDPSELATWLAL